MNPGSSKKWASVAGGIAVAVIIITLVIGMNFAGVSDQTEGPETSVGSSSKLRVIASFYPLYEFARNVGGERAEVTTFVPLGVEPHDWDPSPSVIRQLRTADIFILIGGGFEPWEDKVGGELDDVVSVEITKELIGAEEDGRGPVDPHVWLDPILAKHQVSMIRDALIRADPANTQYYEENTKSYMVELDALDARIRFELSDCERDTFVPFHRAFGYFAERYGLNEVPLGVLPDSEVSPRELRELVEFARSNDIRVIYSEELVDPRLAQALASEVGAQVMVLSPLEGLSDEEGEKGVTYIEKMEQNLQNLKVGLECR